MSFKFDEFKELAKNLEELSKTIDKEIEEFFFNIAYKCLGRIKKRTPVISGQLRNNWELSSVEREGNNLTIQIYNPMEYASYVEYGHKLVKQFVPGEWKGNKFTYNPDSETGTVMGVKTSWVDGKFMATISIREMLDIIPSEWNKRVKKLLGGVK